ncbi:COG3014 family protein [Castellaniella defragrans]|jgi:hypothetical protein|uniref:Lipoprotein n=1 Tax=Castellaniella defragrans (strain DSM 12143 / CCUG 39792 / 65Phen) TaxID=1437824 RepID=W8WUG1_CASD6|nr:hypothetical protein [Castellaniella defragrans]CDM23174.1 hypothetical protein BN940_03496 [Castellaniella defragrans 65Phen]
MILTLWMRRALLGLCATALAGCAGTRTVGQQDAPALLAGSDYRAYAALYLDDRGQPKYDPESLLDSLEAGKAFNDAGMWALSRDAFDAAARKLNWKEDTVDTPEEVANLLGTTLTSDAFGAYQGKIHQGALIDYYQAINHLMLGNEANARVDFNRLQVRQDNSVTQLKAFVSTVNKSVKEGLADEKSEGAKQSLGEVGPKIADGVKDLPGGLAQSKIRMAVGDAMGAVFRATSSVESDKRPNLSRDMLKRAGAASATRGGDAVIAYLGREIRRGNGRLRNKAIILYEDGVGPSLKEFRIDLPLFIVTGKVTYAGIALPQFQPGQAAFGGLKVGAGKTQQETAVLTDVNELAALEFDAAYKGVVAKAVISTVIKTAAQAVINHQIDQQKPDPLVGALLKLGTGAAQYALTKADVRAWANLPNTIQMVVVDRPESGTLALAGSLGQPIAEVPLQEDANTLVLVKASGTSGKPAVYVQALPAEAPVAALGGAASGPPGESAASDAPPAASTKAG